MTTTDKSRADALTDAIEQLNGLLDSCENGSKDERREARSAIHSFYRRALLAASPVEQAAAVPTNGIPATLQHDEGAIARCSYCGRYSLDPKTLSDRQPKCDCGEKHGWSGSFKKPGPDAKWSGEAPAPVDERAAEQDDLIGCLLLAGRHPDFAICMEAAKALREARAASATGAEGAPVAWMRIDDPRDCISDAKKRDMIEHAGAPGARLAEKYSIALGVITPAQAAEPVAIPAGWKLVPVAPTFEMCRAMEEAIDAGWKDSIVWARGIAAAPQHPAQADARAEVHEPHSDDVAVDSFSAVMKHKLALARDKGRGGWEACSPADLSRMLREHVEKGDPRDVANFCMMLWHHGSPIVSAPTQQPGHLTMTVEDAMRIVMANWGDKDAIERMFRANLTHPEPRAEVTDTVRVPARVLDLLNIINRDGVLKRAAELQEVYRLTGAVRVGEAS